MLVGVLLPLDEAYKLHLEILDAFLANINPHPGRVRRDRKIVELHRVSLRQMLKEVPHNHVLYIDLRTWILCP